MNMRWLLNLVLLGIVAVLVLLVAYEPGKQEPVVITLTGIERGSINSISIENKTGGRIRLQQQGDTWTMQEPYALPANRLRIDGLLALADTRSYSQFKVAAADLEKYGLQTPRGSIRLNDIDIDFGDTDAVYKRRYVRIGDTVHLITDTFYHQIITDATSFASTELLAPGSQLKSIDLGDFKLDQQADGSWQVQPEQAASADQINRLVQAWQQAAGVYVKNASDDASIRDIRLTLVDGSTVEYQVLQGDDFILRRREPPLQYHMVEVQRQELLELTPAPAAASDEKSPE
jgi:hypothetical protein